MSSYNTPARVYAPGIGDAVADRTINRVKADGSRETWEDVALRVATGSSLLHPDRGDERGLEFEDMHHHLRQASILMSGRHLQHGDETQPTRNQEVFTNCSTAASSFISFYLLLNGSGVGRSYDDDMMLVDWCQNMPNVVCLISPSHPDVLSGEISKEFVVPDVNGKAKGGIVTYKVADSREGWAKAVEQIERMTWEGTHADKLLVLDFSGVRHRGSPIGGMQNRPASGPGPLMAAIKQIAALKGQGMPAWKSTMYVDHYMAECVLVGGARRAARMATKSWADVTVEGFVTVKKGGVLWSSNNSVTVDEEFWNGVRAVEESIKLIGSKDPIVQQHMLDRLVDAGELTSLQLHAHRVFSQIAFSSYHDGTGEPGLINVDKLTQKDNGVEVLFDGNYAESERFKLDPETLAMTAALAKAFSGKCYTQITNPCGEISLAMLGGYCVIADVVPFHAQSDDDAEDAFRTATRALIRTNTMDCVYSKEVKRTNRIGVGITGLHEYAWSRFGFGFRDLVDEQKSLPFWKMLARFSNACVNEALHYSKELGVNMPHTVTTIKPAGCATPDTLIKMGQTVVTLESVFAANGYQLSDLKAMEAGTWLDVKTPANVLDENNDEKAITKLYVNGYKEVFEIEFEDGFKVKLTGNHKLKTTTGWKRVDELTEEDEIVSY